MVANVGGYNSGDLKKHLHLKQEVGISALDFPLELLVLGTLIKGILLDL